MKTNTVDTVIQDFRNGQNIFRRPSVELMVREVAKLSERIAELEQERRWIPVSERLPEEDDNYFCRVKCKFFTGQKHTQVVQWNTDGWSSHEEVTHWQTLPQPPSEEE